MPKFMLMWEVDTTTMSQDAKGKQQLLLQLQGAVKELLDSGELTDFGEYGGMKGYALMEGTMGDMYRLTTMFIPFLAREKIPPFLQSYRFRKKKIIATIKVS